MLIRSLLLLNLIRHCCPIVSPSVLRCTTVRTQLYDEAPHWAQLLVVTKDARRPYASTKIRGDENPHVLWTARASILATSNSVESTTVTAGTESIPSYKCDASALFLLIDRRGGSMTIELMSTPYKGSSVHEPVSPAFAAGLSIRMPGRVRRA